MSDLKRIGKFYISRKVIENYSWVATRIMSKCIVLRAEMLWVNDSVEYTALSNMFEAIDCASTPPTYEVTVHDDGHISAEVIYE
mgnify:CR=1 FL=1